MTDSYTVNSLTAIYHLCEKPRDEEKECNQIFELSMYMQKIIVLDIKIVYVLGY